MKPPACLLICAGLALLGGCPDDDPAAPDGAGGDLSPRVELGPTDALDDTAATDQAASDATHPDATQSDASTPDASTPDASAPDAAPGKTHAAKSCALSDVKAALAAASHGDKVTVPAGSCAWSGLKVDRAVHLQGAGVGKTKITLSGNNTLTKQAAGVLRLSGFSFSKSGGGNGSKGLTVDGSWKKAQPVVIEDNAFTVSGSGLLLITVAGGVVVADNSFSGGWDDSFLQLKDDQDSEKSWSSASSLGSKDTGGKLNHYIEDNTFYGGTNQGIDADDAVRVVYRHNVLTYSSFNTHGRATSPVGVRHFEVYENTFKHMGGTSQLANQNWAIWIRGGTGVIADNTIDDIAGSYWGNKQELKLTIRGAEDARPQGSCAKTSYPVPHQIGQSHDGTGYVTDPLYLWGNKGTLGISAGWNWGNPCKLSFADFFKWGRDAVKSAKPKPGYKPYTYPHPLRS
jgi:hypothetical protein